MGDLAKEELPSLAYAMTRPTFLKRRDGVARLLVERSTGQRG
jgi:hypothetical protein